jgi:predicted nucleic-acid-binding protein
VNLIGIDTNILIRLLVDDDPSQRPIIEAFGKKLNRVFKGFVTLVTLLELDWALRSQYGYSRSQSVSALRRVLQIRGVEAEHHDAVVGALELVETRNADFADALIAMRALASGCDHVATLDKRAAKAIPGMELLT